jgi:mannitol/fructose-specific phosphotransferase system IIA component (Ntr-type)
MKKVANDLIQLQDLFEARAQQEALAAHGRLTQIDESIQAMLKGIPPDIAGLFQRLQKRSHSAIVPVVNGVCGGCGMALPISMVHAIHAAAAIHTCPSCSRFLYRPDDAAPRHLPGKQSERSPIKAGIARFTSPGLMLPQLASTDRDAAIGEICSVMEAQEFVTHGPRLAEAALHRESLASTAFDHGLAFPHARGVEGGGLTLALGVSPKGIRFTPEQKTLTRIIFFVAIPTAASAFYIRLLAGLTKTFGEESAREKLLTAGTQDKLWKALCQTTRRAII